MLARHEQTHAMSKLMLPVLVAAGALAAFGESTAEKEVLAAQDLWKRAVMQKDAAAFEKVLHTDLMYGHSNGLVETKAQAIKHVVDSKVQYDAIDFSDTKVQVKGNTAVISGKVDYKQNAAGKITAIHLAVLSVWVKTPQGWQMVGRQSTRPAP